MSFFLLSGDTFRIVTFPSFKVASTVVLPGAWSLKWTFHSLGQAGTEVFVFHSFVRASPEVLSCRYLPSCGRVSSHIPVPRRQENGGDHLIALPEKGFWLLRSAPDRLPRCCLASIRYGAEFECVGIIEIRITSYFQIFLAYSVDAPGKNR